MKISGLLNSPKRGMYQITDLGREISSKYGLNITRKLVYSQSAYIEHQKKLQEKSSNDEEVSEEETFELTDTDPYKFEHMMVQLLNQRGTKELMVNPWLLKNQMMMELMG